MELSSQLTAAAALLSQETWYVCISYEARCTPERVLTSWRCLNSVALGG
jgi:hypothetical protein